jgi:hypothetical protein
MFTLLKDCDAKKQLDQKNIQKFLNGENYQTLHNNIIITLLIRL